MKFSTDVVRRVFDDSAGVFIEVGPWPDDTALVELRTADEKSKEWWGSINVAMHPEFARRLGAALLAAASEVEKPAAEAA